MFHLGESKNSLLTQEVVDTLESELPAPRSSQNTVLVLIVTLALFGGGMGLLRDGDWGWVLALIGVVFVHELGHLAAMRLFGFRDLNMFFIPFFGAAASGQKFGASATQRAIVSLAGPVPGVVLGLILAFLVESQEPLIWTSINLLVIINLLNLLPAKPLDGGRFLDVVLFSRWPALQRLTSLLGAGLLALLGYQLESWFFGVLAVFALLGTARQVRLNHAGQLVRAALGGEPITSETIPVDRRETVAQAMQQAWPPELARAGPRVVASLMKRTWLQAAITPAPPGAAAALLLIYVAVSGVGVWLLFGA